MTQHHSPRHDRRFVSPVVPLVLVVWVLVMAVITALAIWL